MPVDDTDEYIVMLDPRGDKPRPLNIRRRFINSSNMAWIGWPSDPSVEPYGHASCMIVEFKGGSRYVYIGVSRQRAVACAYAESSGHYLAERIKPHYEVVKLR